MSEPQTLSGKTILIHGGATGIGAAAAGLFATSGATVLIGDINAEGGRQTADRIRHDGGAADFEFLDVADEQSVAAFVTGAVKRYGRVDGAFLNAADLTADGSGRVPLLDEDSDAVEVDLALFDHTLRVDLRGMLLGLRHVVPALGATGGGSIVCTSSNAVFTGSERLVSYATAKAGIHTLVRNAARRWGKDGVRVNAVAPGKVMVERDHRLGDTERIARELTACASPRLGTPRDVAALVRFLLSDDAEWLTGQVIAINGGSVMR